MPLKTFDVQKPTFQKVFSPPELDVVLSLCDITQVIAMHAYSPYQHSNSLIGTDNT
jgi:hypothetical protein